tara:strand:+ start:822 stop:989 length:168 start_codon:yes stop_codon:yes gene_type:complete
MTKTGQIIATIIGILIGLIFCYYVLNLSPRAFIVTCALMVIWGGYSIGKILLRND